MFLRGISSQSLIKPASENPGLPKNSTPFVYDYYRMAGILFERLIYVIK